MASTIARPRKLKDFLNDHPDSCSSTGFKSFPFTRRLNSKAASTRIAAFQAVINAVKKLPFTTVKSPSIFPRSLSRRLSRKHPPSKPREIKITVRVKDIVRWASFRDLLEEKSRPSDFASSPNHCTTTTTGSTTTTCSSSNGSSWCESDFTSEYLPPSWSSSSTSQECGEIEVDAGKQYLPRVGRDYVETASAGPEVETTTTTCDEKEQQSPVSVLDFQDEEDGEPFSSFARSLAGVERTRQNLMQKIQQFENLAKLEEWMPMEENSRFEEEEEEENEIERKVRELLNHVKATSSIDIGKAKAEKLFFDFFSDELMSSKRCQDKKDDDEFNCEMVSMATAWMKGDHNGLHEWGIEHKKEAYVSEMDRRERWSSLEEEQEEIVLEIETRVLGCLVDEVLADLFLHC